MPFRIAELEGGDAAGIGRQQHRRARRDHAGLVALEPCPHRIDVAGDERHMLERWIVRRARRRVWHPRRIERHELDLMLSELDVDGTRRGALVEPEQRIPGGIAKRLLCPDL